MINGRRLADHISPVIISYRKVLDIDYVLICDQSCISNNITLGLLRKQFSMGKLIILHFYAMTKLFLIITEKLLDIIFYKEESSGLINAWTF